MRNDLPQDLGTVILDLDRRLETLERSPKAYAPGTVNILQYRESSYYLSTTSATYVPLWEAAFDIITHYGFYWEFQASCGAGTTGSAYLAFSFWGAGQFTTSVKSLTTTPTTFSWAIDLTGLWNPGDFKEVLVQLNVKRTGGANSVNVYPPDSAYMASPSLINAVSYTVA